MQNNCQNTNWSVFKHFNSEKKEPKSHKKTKTNLRVAQTHVQQDDILSSLSCIQTKF